jgi:hypothetical protein
MADEDTRRVVVSQPKGASFALSGSDPDDPIRHRISAETVLRTDQPVVHMHLWNEQCVGQLEHKVASVTTPKTPFDVAHRFPDGHQQRHEIASTLAAPVHHALQMRTPLQIRFCNTWQVASDYSVSVALRGRPFLDIRLVGATVATPQPCPEDDCAPVPAAVHP